MKTESDAKKRTLGCAYFSELPPSEIRCAWERAAKRRASDCRRTCRQKLQRPNDEKIGERPRQPRRRRRLVGGDDGEEETRHRTVGRTICVNYCVVLLRRPAGSHSYMRNRGTTQIMGYLISCADGRREQECNGQTGLDPRDQQIGDTFT